VWLQVDKWKVVSVVLLNPRFMQVDYDIADPYFNVFVSNMAIPYKILNMEERRLMMSSYIDDRILAKRKHVHP
jgi:hypothetical protein